VKTLLQNLARLQDLELGETADKNVKTAIRDLRAKIPPQILGHYDRLRARGKKGIAAVRNQVCTGCHMSVPIGTVATILHGTDIQLCDNCGRYLYLPAEENQAGRQPAARPAKTRRTRKVSP
jgi:predicted  nucleic acid-binding Zn-ribbon protein